MTRPQHYGRLEAEDIVQGSTTFPLKKRIKTKREITTAFLFVKNDSVYNLFPERDQNVTYVSGRRATFMSPTNKLFKKTNSKILYSESRNTSYFTYRILGCDDILISGDATGGTADCQPLI